MKEPTDDARIPVQGDTGYWQTGEQGGPKWPGSIAWWEHKKAWEAYNKKYKGAQTALDIAKRHGFSRQELREFLGREPTTYQPAMSAPPLR